MTGSDRPRTVILKITQEPWDFELRRELHTQWVWQRFAIEDIQNAGVSGIAKSYTCFTYYGDCYWCDLPYDQFVRILDLAKLLVVKVAGVDENTWM